MINSVTVRNFRDEEITITLSEAEPAHGLIIKEIKGLGPSNANINTTDFATVDGSMFNSARMTERSIDITLLLTFAPDIETSRQRTYKYFPIKKPVTLIFDTTNRFAKITGYVEKNEPDVFSKEESLTITILCDNPYFYNAKGTQVTEFGAVDPLFEFPFENNSLDENLIEFSAYAERKERLIDYEGDAEVGIRMRIHATDDIGDITIYNFVTKEKMIIYEDKLKSLTGSGLHDGDELFISTEIRNTYASLLRDGSYTNVLNAIDRASDWFQLQKGKNVFAFTTSNDTDDKLIFSIENDVIYEGI